MDFTTYADLSIGLLREIGTGAAAISFDCTGTLTAIARLSGATGIALETTGALSSMQFLAGATSITLNATGALSVNATGRDIDENTMVRPSTAERDMVRTPA